MEFSEVLNMKIRQATLDDIEDILSVIKEAQQRMRLAGMTQWQNNYPNHEIIKSDILNEAIFVLLVDRKIIGTMSVFSYDSVYDAIKGSWLNDNPYKVIHRIALSNDFLGKGMTETMINFVFKHFNSKDIRIDTHPLNQPMIKSLERQGFKYCGIVHVTTDTDTTRYAYHKHIE